MNTVVRLLLAGLVAALTKLEHLPEQPAKAATPAGAADFLVARTRAPVEGNRRS